MQFKTITGVAAAGALLIASSQAHALSFGEAAVRSALGERLLIEIPISSAATTPPSCFIVSPDGYRPGLFRLERIGNSLILRSTQTVREPLLSFTLRAQCAGEAKLTRRYDVFIDPAERLSAADRLLRARRDIASRETPLATTRRRQPTPRAATPTIDGNTYTVSRGDTLWEIVDRLGAQPRQHWQIIDQIVAANPGAFIDGNADRLISGAVLSLPSSLSGTAQTERVTVAQPTPSTPAPASTATTAERVSVPVAVVSDAATGLRNDGPNASEASADDSQPAEPSSVAQAERTAALLSVLSQDDSPFKEVASEPESRSSGDAGVDTSAAVAAAPGLQTPVIDSAGQTSQIGWGARVGAVLAGVCLVIAAWVALQLLLGVSARRRRIEASRNLQPERRPIPARLDNAPVPTAARAPVSAAAAQPMINAPVADGSIEFEAPDQFASIDFEVSPTEALDLDFEVGTPTLTGIEEVDWLDSQTQELLEQDYEAELSRTQQIQKELAEEALRMRTTPNASSEEPTVNMPAVDEETVDMPHSPDYEVSVEEYDVSAEALDLADAAIAEFTASLNVEDDLQAIEDSQRTASLELPESKDDGSSDDDQTEVMPPAREA